MDENQLSRLLIPTKKTALQKGLFSWPKQPILASPHPADTLPLNQLRTDLSLYHFKAHLSKNASAPAVLRIHRTKDITGSETYRIAVTPDRIDIYAATDAAAYYALQTLRDIVKIYGTILPACEIEDTPDFPRRGVYLDCSRGKVPKLNTLKELATWLAHWKINEIQLYIENVFTFKKHPLIGKDFSPFKPDEILSLQNHCRTHHIRLVGSLASFGHLEKILALPKYQRLGEMPGFRDFPGGTTLCPTDPGSIKLIEQLYSEFLPLFEAEDFNVCCDETWELGKGRSKKQADRLGIGCLYLNFILKIHRLCEKHGKRMNLWADIALKYPDLLHKLPRDIVLLNWEYEQDGPNITKTKNIADAGIPFMVCPGTSSWLTHGSRLPNSIANVKNFAAKGRKFHAEGLLNTDWGDNGHRNFLGVSLHSFAHGAAHAWHGKAVDDSKFTDKFCYFVFGPNSDHLADSIRLLGNTYLMCGKTLPNKSLLYNALVQPQTDSTIDMMTTAGLEQIIAQLTDKKLWSAPTKITGRFEQLAIEELKLAAKMDCFASRRTLAAKTLRAGKTLPRRELQKLSTQINDISEDFKKLWLARNKVSRLHDNLRLFEQIEKELKCE